MKILLLISLLIVCGFGGVQIRQALHKRFLFYSDLCKFIDDFIVNINFSQESFKNFITNKRTTNADLEKILHNYLEFGKDKMLKLFYLQDQNLNEVYAMLSEIGLTDAENQIVILKNYKNIFEKRKAEAENFDKKYSSLAVKISILVGLLVDIILI